LIEAVVDCDVMTTKKGGDLECNLRKPYVMVVASRDMNVGIGGRLDVLTFITVNEKASSARITEGRKEKCQKRVVAFSDVNRGSLHGTRHWERFETGTSRITVQLNHLV
jgi:hypothetical protein